MESFKPKTWFRGCRQVQFSSLYLNRMQPLVMLVTDCDRKDKESKTIKRE